jgi:adenylate cyclase class IV
MVENKPKIANEGLESSEERELKLSVDETLYRTLLEQLSPGAQEVEQSYLTDTYYDDPTYLLTNLNRGLRLRTGPKTTPSLEFKSLFYVPELRPNNPWLVEEKIFAIPTNSSGLENLAQIFKRFDRTLNINTNEHLFYESDIDALLKSSGFEPRIVVVKTRTELKYDHHTFSFDQIQGLGHFIEIETHDNTDPQHILDQTGIFPDLNIVREGYNDMLAAQNPKVNPAHDRQKLFQTSPTWNILPGEEVVIKKLLNI